MHELAITQEIVKILNEEVEKNKLHNVSKVVVDLGEFTSYKKESIEFYYDELKKENKMLADSILDVNLIAGNDFLIKEIIGD